MVRCAAVGCDNDQRSSEGISFYRLPKNKELQKKWKNAIKRDRLSKDTRLCLVHLDDNSFQRDLKVKSFMKMILHMSSFSNSNLTFIHLDKIFNKTSISIYVYKIVNLFCLFL